MNKVFQSKMNAALPLPCGDAHFAGNLISGDGKEFRLLCGLGADLIGVLKTKSCNVADTELHTNTSDRERFCTHTYEEWYKKERYPFALTSEKKELAGIIWFGPKALPVLDTTESDTTVWDTFAIRMYEPYRGKRLARPFAAAVIHLYRTQKPGRKIWLETNEGNVGAISLYEKLHFKKIGYTESRRLVMVLTE